MKRRVFSGIQPTGKIHIGNYLGAIRQWVALQREFESIFCIVDLHAITTPQGPVELKSKIREVAGILFAAGIDPRLSSVFVQSRVSAHAELAWILNCFIPMGWLRRMTQFKEKEETEEAPVSVGLFDYPVLMAADILLYDTDIVPVGDDQLQHVELARDVAQRFNSIYGETFRLPEAAVPGAGARIMGLDDPTKKMSKSDTHPGHAIYLLDPPDDIRAKIMRATTDSLREITFDEKRPGIYNLLVVYELFTSLSRAEIEARYQGKGYAEFKEDLAMIVIDSLRPLQSRCRELAADPGYIDSLLTEGEARVRAIAERTLSVVKGKVGLG